MGQLPCERFNCPRKKWADYIFQGQLFHFHALNTYNNHCTMIIIHGILLVEFKKWLCHMSLSYSCPLSPLRCCHIACQILKMPYEYDYVVSLFLVMLICPMLHVDFKKWLCRRVELRGQGPYISVHGITTPVHVKTQVQGSLSYVSLR